MAKRKPTSHPNIFRYENGILYYRKGQFEKSLKTKDEKRAIKKLEVLLQKQEGEVSTSKLKFKDLYQDYLKDLEDMLDPESKKELERKRARKKAKS